MFQVALRVACKGGFVARPNLRGLHSTDADERVSDLQYRDAPEYVVGHGVGTHATLTERGCAEVVTTWLPTAQVEKVIAAPVDGEFDMGRLAQTTSGDELVRKLTPLVDAYRTWLTKQNVSGLSPRREEIAAGLLSEAKQRITLAGFVIVKGDQVFGALVQRMDAEPGLQVTLYLNVPAARGASPEAAVSWFATDFREQVWPGERLPVVYYDPRSLEPSTKRRAVLHAKCVVVDGTSALVTSANFTPHAQLTNIELGVKLEDPGLAARIEAQFDQLVQKGLLLRLPGT